MKRRISINNGVAVPQSFITKNKQRVKQYADTVYLENGDEFQLELFNPTQNKVLAKIELNGTSIGSGVVLRPGERVFLERYLNEPKKFKYDTYFVDDNNPSVDAAIKQNGDVMVSFYDEEKPINMYNGTFASGNGSITNINYLSPSGYTTSFPTFTTFNDNITYTTNMLNINSDTLSFSSSEVKSASLNPRSFAKTKETGRIEKGGDSSQKLTYDSTRFKTTKIATNWWKILPMSEKVKTIDEVHTFYCSSCGTKRKKDNYKFCPNCGTKFVEEKEPKIIFTEDIMYIHYINGEFKRLYMGTFNDTLDKFLERHKHKSKIIIKRDSLTENQLQAILID